MTTARPGSLGQPEPLWRRSRADVYPAGAAYQDRLLVKEKDGKTGDFALAIYPAP